MKPCLKTLLLALALLTWLPAARAAITCTSITSPGVSINYINNTTASVQTFFTVSCTRTSASDPQSITYSVRTADNGQHANGVNNRARHVSNNFLRYDLYTNAGCGSHWKGNTAITDTITWGSATGTISKQTSFWGCITSAQTASASGAYLDTVGITLTYGNNIDLPGTVPVAIYAPALCTLTTPPGNINLAYAAFGPQVSASTTFAVRCTIDMPYTMATDVPEAVLTGLRYQLAVSAASSNGTGAPQSFSITATIPAGQAGTCLTASCNASRTHTLLISY